MIGCCGVEFGVPLKQATSPTPEALEAFVPHDETSTSPASTRECLG